MSRITGLVREIVMARIFGAGQVADAFLIGFRIPNLTRDLFAEGALSSAFVPVFSEYLSKKTKEEAAALANLVATALIVVVGSVCLLGIIFAPQLVMLFASGYTQVPGKFELAVLLTRIMFPFLLLVALAAQAMGVLNACNQFGVPALASTFFNLGSLFFGLLLGFWAGSWIGISQIEGMAYGVVLGGALQLLWQVPSLNRAGFRFRPGFDWSHPGMSRILHMMGPAILGNAAVQINVLINTSFASRLVDPLVGPNGPVSWLSYAFRFMQLPLGIFGVAVASATLPSISRSAAANNIEEFRETLSRSLSLVFFLTAPSSIGLAVLGESIVGAIYQGGRFELYDTQQTARALSCYALGLVGYSVTKVLNPAFYALADSRTPLAVSALSVLINWTAVTAIVNKTSLGHAGLALSTSLVAAFGGVALLWIMRARIGGIHGRRIRTTALQVTCASAIMGGAIWLSSRVVVTWLGTGKLARLTDLAISIPLGLAVFYCVSLLMRIPELDTAKNTLGNLIRRRVPRAAL